MNFQTYQQLAQRTIPAEWDNERTMAHAALKIPGEAGEIADMFGKVYQGHKLDTDKLILELGDLLWHLAEMATGMNVSLEYIAIRNIEKLKARYPRGFEVERSVNRAEYVNGQGVTE